MSLSFAQRNLTNFALNLICFCPSAAYIRIRPTTRFDRTQTPLEDDTGRRQIVPQGDSVRQTTTGTPSSQRSRAWHALLRRPAQVEQSSANIQVHYGSRIVSPPMPRLAAHTPFNSAHNGLQQPTPGEFLSESRQTVEPKSKLSLVIKFCMYSN